MVLNCQFCWGVDGHGGKRMILSILCLFILNALSTFLFRHFKVLIITTLSNMSTIIGQETMVQFCEHTLMGDVVTAYR